MDAAAVASGKAFNRAEASKAWDRWAICSRCGSQKILTVSKTRFTPTGLADSRAAAASMAAVSPTRRPPPQQPPTRQPPVRPPAEYASSTPGRDSTGAWQPGSLVIVRQLGYRGLRGTVLRRGPMGNYTISLDRGDKAVSIPGDKLDPV
jgi:hypothetical protein